MAFPQFIFHIGSHKTGTTSLQAVFQALTPALAARGVLVPEGWRQGPGQSGHHQLPIELRAGSTDILKRELHTIMQSAFSRVLISSEDLSNLPPREVALLGSLLDGVDTSFIFYCRRWSDYLPSHWQTAVQGGISASLPQTLRPFLREPAEHAAVNFALKLDKYARVFGRDRISIVSYSNIIDSGMNLAHHFFETFLPGERAVLDAAPEVADLSLNVSLSVPNIEMIRGFNVLARDHGEKRGSGPSTWLLWHADRQDPRWTRLQKMIEPARRVITVDDNSPRFRALHSTLLRTWGDRLVEPRHADRLFEPRVRELPFISPGRLRAPAIEKVLLTLYDDYRRDTGLPPRHD